MNYTIVKVALFIAILGLFPVVLPALSKDTPAQATTTPQEASTPVSEPYSATTTALLALTNEARETPLSANPTLMAAAQARASYFCTHPFEHFSADGVTPWIFFDAVGYHYLHAGENLARYFSTPEAMQAGWMASPTHKKNILDSKFKDIGIGESCGVTVELFGTNI